MGASLERMAATLYPHALTTLDNLKGRLGITTTGFDQTLTRLINQITDRIERLCNRQFASRAGNTTLNVYTQEVYDGQDGGRFLQLRQAPVASLSSFQYRAGVPTAPAWTDFVPTTYEIDQNGRTGMIRVYGGVPRGTSNLRATYTAGYAVDWAHEGQATHTLPSDLTALCEKMCVREFQRRTSVGKSSESASGASTTWSKDLDDDDKATIAAYTLTSFYA